MNTWIRRTLQVGLISAGFVIVGAAAAQAADVNHGVLNGNNVLAPVQLPVNLCGNAVGVLGDASAGCEGGATARNTHSAGGGMGTTKNHGVLNGNTIAAPIQAPINVCGNAVGLLGDAEASCDGGATAHLASAGGGAGTTKNHGIGNGNLIYVPVQAPVNVCGNAVGSAEASCKGGATARNTASANGAGSMGHTLNKGIGNGNGVLVPVQLPANVCGNTAALFGDSAAACEGGALAKFGPHTPTRAELAATAKSLHRARQLHANGGGNGAGSSTVNHGILNGNTVSVPVQVPVNVCGNAVGVFGDAEAACEGGATARNTKAAGAWAHKVINHGLLNGNHVMVPVQAPVNVAGNAVGIFGDAAAYASGGATAQLL